MVENVDIVRTGWRLWSAGDVDGLAGLLAPDLYWGGPEDSEWACHNREEALSYMREGGGRGDTVELVDVQPLRDGRVLVVLQASERPERHAQIVTVREGLISEMTVYATVPEAIAAAGPLLA